MGYEVQREEYQGYTIRIETDDDAGSPRDWDNLGTMVCWHRRYNLGDKHDFDSPQDFFDFLKSRRAEHKVKKGRASELLLPLFLYDHSGLAMSTSDFLAFDPGGWDSGQVGYIYVTYDRLREEYSSQRVTPAILERARRCLIGEVSTYDDFLRGNVYGYIISDGADDHIDSCWGCFDGEDEYNGAYALSEARSVVDSLIEQGRAAVPSIEAAD